MIVKASKPFPDTQTLVSFLKQEFPEDYIIRLFGNGKQQSIMVQQSSWVSVQLTVDEDEILVDGSFPNLLISSIMTLISVCTFPLTRQWSDLEKHVASVLHRKYP